jgi:hypothetical protein
VRVQEIRGAERPVSDLSGLLKRLEALIRDSLSHVATSADALIEKTCD